ncbi:glycosyltransferase family 4 protein [Lacticaseibacillus kribbianus]|uniref:glycosyltransferase family 4 protein n=1 Tax=Lacticaseibacillus kribbianus TaxID=2926292 RepID=UPI001CD743AD|nr:glycosyltransferase family 4 protein [Lacticaseibacillus kribbianus]
MYKHLKRTKALFITNYPAPYRVDFFNLLGEKIDLTVAFTSSAAKQKHRNPAWFTEKKQAFSAVYLKGQNGNRVGSSLSRIIGLLRQDFEQVIVGTYSKPKAMLLIVIMKMLKKPYWIETDGGMKKSGQGFREQVKRFLIGGAVGYYSPSSVSDDYLCFYGADRSQIHRYRFSSVHNTDVISHGVAASQKVALRNNLRLGVEPLVIGVGQVIPRKGWDILIKALAKISDPVQVVIVGGQATPDLEQLISSELIGNIKFIPFLGREQLIDYYRAADIFVLPTREDIWGLVVGEALAQGLPTVTTNNCGAGLEMIRNGFNGYLVASENTDDLATKIVKLLGDEELRHRMSINAINVAQGYTIEAMVSDHVNSIKAATAEFDN